VIFVIQRYFGTAKDSNGLWFWQDRTHFYASKNLKEWTFQSEFGKDLGGHGGVWECPDLFPLKVEGTNEEKWVLIVNINPGGPNNGSAGQYFVGDFDGKTFKIDEHFTKQLQKEKAAWLDWEKTIMPAFHLIMFRRENG
jgi:levanase/fructan beta-fructosidase